MQGRAVAEGRTLNPQAGAGADVMSRLAVARVAEGRAVLAGLARRQLLGIMDSLAKSGTGRVTRLCLAANTAMTDIFLDRDVEGLCAAPYRLTHSGDETVALPDFPPLYVPPLPAPFVGGDVSAGLAALLEAGVPRPFVLADLGTNGELALVTETGQLWLTSVPLGPALEGIGPECGQLAGPGVVTGFTLTPLGLAAQFYESASPDAENAADAARHHAAQGAVCPCPACQSANAGQNPEGLAAGSAAGAGVGSAGAVARGISATGYLSLLALLLRAGALRNDGQFVANPAMPLARKLAAGLEQPNLAGEPPSSGQPRSGARLRLPERKAIIALLKEMRQLLFPAYFGDPELMSLATADYAALILERVEAQLRAQIALALPESEANRAAEVAREIIERMPYIQEMLLKDLDATFDGDPAAASKEEVIFSYPGLYAIYVYRIAHVLYEQNVPIIPRIMTELAHSGTGIDIGAGAQIGEYFFIDFSVENKTNLPFDIDELRVKLQDKKQEKSTNVQVIELKPAFILDRSVKFRNGYRNVIVLKKMTFPNDKVLTLELSEKQISGRTISLNLDYEDVLSADSFDTLLLKEQ